ncbi:MAG: MarR family transcriptional regulator [Oscillospiraceae bacterium]|nr:MarR family transcriptional regulator [Oscillospiraceae bacterium]
MKEENSTDLARELMDVLRQFKRTNFDDIQPGVTPSEIMLLNVLKQELTNKNENGIKASELSEKCSVTRSSITQTIGNLEQAGFVVRTMDETDRRAIRVKLTEKGEKLYTKHADEMVKFVNELSEYLGNEEVIRLIISLKKINEFLKLRKNKL